MPRTYDPKAPMVIDATLTSVTGEVIVIYEYANAPPSFHRRRIISHPVRWSLARLGPVKAVEVLSWNRRRVPRRGSKA